MDITAWTQEHVQKSWSVNTVHYGNHNGKLKLYHDKIRTYVNIIHNDGPKVI